MPRVEHYPQERPHQGLRGALIVRGSGGAACRRERLGGLLNCTVATRSDRFGTMFDVSDRR